MASVLKNSSVSAKLSYHISKKGFHYLIFFLSVSFLIPKSLFCPIFKTIETPCLMHGVDLSIESSI